MKKPDLGRLLTLYGRKPVLEALQDKNLQLFRLHLADSNRQEGILLEIQKAAKQRGVEIQTHGKRELSRISKNSQQDQGVALDILMPGFIQADAFLMNLPTRFQIIAVDGITNPQNLGMIYDPSVPAKLLLCFYQKKVVQNSTLSSSKPVREPY